MELRQIAQMTGINEGDLILLPATAYKIILFGCQKAMAAIPEGWSYEYSDLGRDHWFTHEDYAPADDDRDSEHFISGYDFIQTLNEVYDQETEWQELFKGTKERLSKLTIRG